MERPHKASEYASTTTIAHPTNTTIANNNKKIKKPKYESNYGGIGALATSLAKEANNAVAIQALEKKPQRTTTTLETKFTLAKNVDFEEEEDFEDDDEDVCFESETDVLEDDDDDIEMDDDDEVDDDEATLLISSDEEAVLETQRISLPELICKKLLQTTGIVTKTETATNTATKSALVAEGCTKQQQQKHNKQHEKQNIQGMEQKTTNEKRDLAALVPPTEMPLPLLQPKQEKVDDDYEREPTVWPMPFVLPKLEAAASDNENENENENEHATQHAPIGKRQRARAAKSKLTEANEQQVGQETTAVVSAAALAAASTTSPRTKPTAVLGRISYAATERTLRYQCTLCGILFFKELPAYTQHLRTVHQLLKELEIEQPIMVMIPPRKSARVELASELVQSQLPPSLPLKKTNSKQLPLQPQNENDDAQLIAHKENVQEAHAPTPPEREAYYACGRITFGCDETASLTLNCKFCDEKHVQEETFKKHLLRAHPTQIRAPVLVLMPTEIINNMGEINTPPVAQQLPEVQPALLSPTQQEQQTPTQPSAKSPIACTTEAVKVQKVTRATTTQTPETPPPEEEEPSAKKLAEAAFNEASLVKQKTLLTEFEINAEPAAALVNRADVLLTDTPSAEPTDHNKSELPKLQRKASTADDDSHSSEQKEKRMLRATRSQTRPGQRPLSRNTDVVDQKEIGDSKKTSKEKETVEMSTNVKKESAKSKQKPENKAQENHKPHKELEKLEAQKDKTKDEEEPHKKLGTRQQKAESTKEKEKQHITEKEKEKQVLEKALESLAAAQQIVVDKVEATQRPKRLAARSRTATPQPQQQQEQPKQALNPAKNAKIPRKRVVAENGAPKEVTKKLNKVLSSSEDKKPCLKQTTLTAMLKSMEKPTTKRMRVDANAIKVAHETQNEKPSNYKPFEKVKTVAKDKSKSWETTLKQGEMKNESKAKNSKATTSEELTERQEDPAKDTPCVSKSIVQKDKKTPNVNDKAKDAPLRNKGRETSEQSKTKNNSKAIDATNEELAKQEPLLSKESSKSTNIALNIVEELPPENAQREISVQKETKNTNKKAKKAENTNVKDTTKDSDTVKKINNEKEFHHEKTKKSDRTVKDKGEDKTLKHKNKERHVENAAKNIEKVATRNGNKNQNEEEKAEEKKNFDEAENKPTQEIDAKSNELQQEKNILGKAKNDKHQNKSKPEINTKPKKAKNEKRKTTGELKNAPKKKVIKKENTGPEEPIALIQAPFDSNLTISTLTTSAAAVVQFDTINDVPMINDLSLNSLPAQYEILPVEEIQNNEFTIMTVVELPTTSTNNTVEDVEISDEGGDEEEISDEQAKNVLSKRQQKNDTAAPAKTRAKHVCDICLKVFKKSSRLADHIRLHTGEKPFQCDQCDKSFRIKMRLTEHKMRHRPVKQFECGICGFALATKQDLAQHMRHHSDERPHVCSDCPKAFIRASDLKIHMRIHTGERPYVCDVCNATFRANQNLSVHRKTHLGDKKYKCEHCDKHFLRIVDCRIHMRSHTGERPYKCEICGRGFSSKFNARNHIQRQHGVNQKSDKNKPPKITMKAELARQKELIDELRNQLSQRIKMESSKSNTQQQQKQKQQQQKQQKTQRLQKVPAIGSTIMLTAPAAQQTIITTAEEQPETILPDVICPTQVDECESLAYTIGQMPPLPLFGMPAAVTLPFGSGSPSMSTNSLLSSTPSPQFAANTQQQPLTTTTLTNVELPTTASADISLLAVVTAQPHVVDTGSTNLPVVGALTPSSSTNRTLH